MEAKIKNNKPICLKCEILLKEESLNVELITNEEDDKYYLFTRVCSRCRTEQFYCVDLNLEKRYELKTIGKFTKINN